MNTLSVTVFCGARPGRDPHYLQAARELGAGLARRGWRLVYGGGNTGLMGEVASACLAAGGHVTGVIPGFLASQEVKHQGLTVCHEVEDLFERKSLLIELADAYITLPGGVGTFDELLEVITWRQLERIDKPIALLDSGGYWQPFLQLLEHARAHDFLHGEAGARLIRHTSVEALLEELAAALTLHPPALP